MPSATHLYQVLRLTFPTLSQCFWKRENDVMFPAVTTVERLIPHTWHGYPPSNFD